MQEIEAKILDVNREELEEKLKQLGAVKKFSGEVYAVFFDTPDLYLKHNNSILRLRKEGDKTKLTLKTGLKQEAVKSCEENEVEVSDFEGMAHILETLGYQRWKEIKKRRISYSLGKVHFEFDQFLGEHGCVPEFMEIEAPDEKILYDYAAKLGYKKEDCKSWTIPELMKHYH